MTRSSSRPAAQGLTRRHFLHGAGGALLALPFLPSLSTKAFACEATPAGPGRCFVAMGTDHGNVWSANFYPSDSVLTEQLTYAGRTVRHGLLPSAPTMAGRTFLSPVLNASASVLTPALLAKFNVLRGVDIPYRISHHVGGHLGNFAATVGNVTMGLDNTAFMVPTIDQVMAWSPSFYSAQDLASRMTRRSVHVGGGDLSWNYTAPAAKVGKLVTQPAHVRNLDLYKHLFQPGSSLNGVDQFVVDKIKGSYDRLKRHPRLSHGDRQRLDAHVGRLAEIERKLAVISNLAAPPAAPATDSNVYYLHHSFPHDPNENRLYWGLMNDILVLAFSAGLTRVATMHQHVKFAATLIQDWHGQVAHAGFGAAVAQGWTVGWNQGTFEHVMVDLAAKMDAVTTADGGNLLDNSLLMFSQEAGQYTHHSGCVNYPIVTAGGAGGYFQTGRFVDFTNHDVIYQDLAELAVGQPEIKLESPGLYYNQFLGNVLESMGVCPPEGLGGVDFLTRAPTAGYGFHHVEASRAADYASARAVMGDRLPVITRA